MAITVIAAPNTLAAEECTNFDQQALRRRVITLSKQFADDGDTQALATANAQADVDAAVVGLQVFADAIPTAEALVVSETATFEAGKPYIDQPAEDAAYVAVQAAIDGVPVAYAALKVAGDAEAVLTNTAWYGNGGIPLLADISGVQNV